MIEVELNVGGRKYRVACNPGEEAHLHAAATLLDKEAMKVSQSLERIPESKMLLLAGLMLADEMKELEWRAKSENERAREFEGQLRNTEKAQANDTQSRAEIAALKQDLAAVSKALENAQAQAKPASDHEELQSEIQKLTYELAASKNKERELLALTQRFLDNLEELATSAK